VRFDRPGTPSPTARARSLRRRMTWSEKRLWAEIDGGVHERMDSVALRDGERQLWLQSQGYRVVRFTDREVEYDPEGCAERVRSLLQNRQH
jgi:very-short-patch-repair endonuclease